MSIATTVELKRDTLEDDFKACKQKILCPIPITSQMITFIENVVNANVKDKEYFVIKAPCGIEVYTLFLNLPYYKTELTIDFLKTYDGDLISIDRQTQIF